MRTRAAPSLAPARRPRSGSIVVRAMAALGAAAVLGALLVGLPLALLEWGRWPITGVPTSQQVRDLPSLIVTESSLFGIMTVAAWLAWLLFAVSVVVELFAEVQGRNLFDFPLGRPFQISARKLVASLLMSVSATGAAATPAGASPVGTTGHTIEADPVDHFTSFAGLGTSARAGDMLGPVVSPQPHLPAPPARPAMPDTAGVVDQTSDVDTTGPRNEADSGSEQTIMVHPGDTPWSLAEQHLGDGTGWRDLFEANKDRAQPDGRSWTDPEVIHPGWQLRLPSDEPAQAETEDPAALPPWTYEVQPGDSLSSIAQEELDDPFGTRVPEIVELNQEVISDPDLIQPGWLITLPDELLSQGGAQGPPDEVGVSQSEMDVGRGSSRSDGPVQLPQETVDAPTSASSSEQQQDGFDWSVSKWAIPTAGALLGAYVLNHLARSRRAQVRRRRPGSPLPLMDGEQSHIEMSWRTIAELDASHRADAVLRALTGDLRGHGGAIDVAGLRITTEGVDVLLGTPTPSMPPGYQSLAPDGTVWRAVPDGGETPLELRALQSLPLLPGLVTLGDTRQGVVQLDLERMGALSAEGDPQRVQAWLAATALELASAPWARSVSLRVVGMPAEMFAPFEQVEVVNRAEDLVAEATSFATGMRTALNGRSTQTARCTGSEPWPPLMVIVATGEVPSELLAQALEPDTGVAITAAGPLPGAPCQLEIAGDGDAMMQPLSLRFRAAGLDQDVARATGSLLVAAAAPAVPAPGEAAMALGSVSDADAQDHPSHARLETVERIMATAEVEVSVLGAVEVTGWTREPAPRAEEIIAYLILHGGEASLDDVGAAIWPRGIAATDLREALSRTRVALGVSQAQGHQHLAPADDGVLRLADTVCSDWWRFSRLLAEADGTNVHDRVLALSAALELVRGQPFEGVPASAFGWAEPLTYRMQAAMTDTAHLLAETALELDNPELAEWAARQGQLGVPGQEALYCVIGQARALAGDRAGCREAYDEAVAAVQELDPLGDLDPRSKQVFEQALEGVE